jgi:hypothetical protein
MNENQKHQANQQNHQENNQMVQKQNEQKTVVNGKFVSVQQAQQMEEQFNKQNNKTGIQEHHNNQSESVQAGQIAQNQQQVLSQQSGHNIKAVNVQSGQQHLEQFQGQGEMVTEQQKMQQAEHDAVQGSVDANNKSKAKANNKKVD